MLMSYDAFHAPLKSSLVKLLSKSSSITAACDANNWRRLRLPGAMSYLQWTSAWTATAAAAVRTGNVRYFSHRARICMCEPMSILISVLVQMKSDTFSIVHKMATYERQRQQQMATLGV